MKAFFAVMPKSCSSFLLAFLSSFFLGGGGRKGEGERKGKGSG